MKLKTIASHAFIACTASAVTYLLATDRLHLPTAAQAQTPQGQRVTELFKQEMKDVGRVLSVRLTERDPGNGSGAHRHPGSYTVGYIVEGTYEVKIDDGPVRRLKP